jgi:hypothetical protein
MIEKYARCVIHEGLERQFDFNYQFMMGLHKCIKALDTVDYESYSAAVSRIIVNVGAVDPTVAAALSEYVATLITEAEGLEADFGTWKVG